MNVFIGMGRLVNDPKVTVKENADETTTIARYRLAIDRVASNNESADFLSVVAFGKNAEFAESKAVNESFKDSSENKSSEISENIEKPPFEQEDE